MTLAIAGYFAYVMVVAEDKQEILIGDASHGHFQIELSCNACHTDAFGGGEVIQTACEGCHAEELKEAHDSHPRKKFTDPRNADRLEIMDARQCVTCHTEHQKEQTHPMGVTVPDDYCYHCHKDVGEERESHKDLAFDSCASAGCHNYHDNRALYESFLVDNSGGEWLKEIATLPSANHAAKTAKVKSYKPSPEIDEGKQAAHPDIASEWLASAHGQSDIGCSGCHTEKSDQQWIEKPGIEQCQSCHQQEAKGFLSGKHGMRLAASLSAMTPSQSELPFKTTAMHTEQGCISCHGAHDFNTQRAAVEACLGCHNDEHSQNFMQSPHGQLAIDAWNLEAGQESAVTCATCHMPKLVHKTKGKEAKVRVEHNQNAVLRPNEKMIRPVCMQCHSLEFSIDALASPELIKNNFSGKPTLHVPSVDWAKERVKE
ncbi:cytochrome c3 family protein [Maricurvus nonylphenolicus]